MVISHAINKNNDLFSDDNIKINYCYFLSENKDIYLNFKNIQREAASDKILQKVIYFIEKGCPKKLSK